MSNFTIEIKVPGLIEAISSLAAALTGQKAVPQIQNINQQTPPQQGNISTPVNQVPAVQAQPVQQPGQYQQPVYQAPAQQPQPTYQAPVQQYQAQQTYQQPQQGQQYQPQPEQQYNPQQAPIQQPLPTTHTAQSYTQDQLAVAMTGLVDAGKHDILRGILSSFSANSLMDIVHDQYPALAIKLKEAGANI